VLQLGTTQGVVTVLTMDWVLVQH